MKHREVHSTFQDGCDPCKWATLGLSTATISRERKGEGPMGDEGTQAYVNKMFADRRREGKADPIPTTAAARKFMPAAGISRDRKYREANGGL